jgi:hypothetical protein
MAGVDKFLNAGATDVAETSGNSLVEALPRISFGHDEFMNRGLVALAHAVIVAVLVNCALDALRSKEHSKMGCGRVAK